MSLHKIPDRLSHLCHIIDISLIFFTQVKKLSHVHDLITCFGQPRDGMLYFTSKDETNPCFSCYNAAAIYRLST